MKAETVVEALDVEKNVRPRFAARGIQTLIIFLELTPMLMTPNIQRMIASFCVATLICLALGRSVQADVLRVSSTAVPQTNSAAAANTEVFDGMLQAKTTAMGKQTARTNPLGRSMNTPEISKIVVGTSHTCALTTAGGVKCWGTNDNGQLGDGTTTDRSTPVDVVGLSSGVSAVFADDPTCALTTAGGVKCWGENYAGQLGDGTTTDRSTPVDVVGDSGDTTAIALGDYHTCALTMTGGIKCWGYNEFGQLGDGTINNHYPP